MQDEQIILLYWERKESAISETKAAYEKYLMKIIGNILGDFQDSLECVNDVYLKIWNSIPPHKPAVFSTYIGKIARETAIDAYRKHNRQKRKPTEYTVSLEELGKCVSGIDNVEKEIELKLLGKEINRFLQSLPTEHCAVFVMRYYHSDSLKDISECMNMSQAKVKGILHRARKGLKKHLEKEDFEL